MREPECAGPKRKRHSPVVAAQEAGPSLLMTGLVLPRNLNVIGSQALPLQDLAELPPLPDEPDDDLAELLGGLALSR